MFRFEIEKWLPKFLLADKNGYAMAKAIEAGLQKMNDIIAAGVDCVSNYDTMPEWRLDELAWETNCLYDYSADIETKRKWIRDALPMYRIYGTPQAIYQYIGNYFQNVDLEENWIYGGEPYHFRITVEGAWTPENEAWTKKAVATAKNVRSVLDDIRIGCKCYIGISASGEMLTKFRYPFTGERMRAGTWPQDAYMGVTDETGAVGVETQAAESKFHYPFTGTKPYTNTLGITDGAAFGMDAVLTGYGFDYAKTAENLRTGTKPQNNMVGVMDQSDVGLSGASESIKFGYEFAGTKPDANTLGTIDNASLGAGSELTGYTFSYPKTAEKQKAGTKPEENTKGIVAEGDAQGTSANGIAYKIKYKMCGDDTF